MSNHNELCLCGNYSFRMALIDRQSVFGINWMCSSGYGDEEGPE